MTQSMIQPVATTYTQATAPQLFPVMLSRIVLRTLWCGITVFIFLCVIGGLILEPSHPFRTPKSICLWLGFVLCLYLPKLYQVVVAFISFYLAVWFLIPGLYSHRWTPAQNFYFGLAFFLCQAMSARWANKNLPGEQPVQVDSAGIEQVVFVQRNPSRKRFDWDEIGTVRVVNRPWLLIPTLLITEREYPKTIKQFPFCLEDRAGFIAAVREFAPSDNPLRLFIEQEIISPKE